MMLVYLCKHCDNKIGEINDDVAIQSYLSRHELTSVDGQKMFQYKPNGEIYMKVICEACESALNEHPKYYELQFFIH